MMCEGIQNFDVQTAYQYMKLASTTPRAHNGRSDLDGWLQKGYVRSEQEIKSAARTLAYSCSSLFFLDLLKFVINSFLFSLR